MASRGKLGVVCFTVFLDLVGFGMIIPLLPLYAERLHASDRQIGLLMAIFSVMQLFFAPLWGRLSDRAGRRPVLLVSIAGSCLSQLVFALAPSFAWLLSARALAGLSSANISAAQAYVADVTADQDRAHGMAMLGAAMGLGFVVGPAMGGFLSTHGPSLPFVVASGLAALNFVLALVLLDEPRSEATRTSARTLTRAGLRQAFRDRRIRWALLLFFIVTFGFSMLESTFSIYVERRFGYGRRAIALLFTYVGCFVIAVQGGAVRRLAPRLGERRLVILGTGLMALGLFLLAVAHSLAMLLWAIAVVSTGNALNTPSLAAIISRLAGVDVQGSVLGVSQSTGALARIAGPLAGTAALALGLGAPYFAGAMVLGLASCLAAASLQQPVSPEERKIW